MLMVIAQLVLANTNQTIDVGGSDGSCIGYARSDDDGGGGDDEDDDCDNYDDDNDDDRSDDGFHFFHPFSLPTQEILLIKLWYFSGIVSSI